MRHVGTGFVADLHGEASTHAVDQTVNKLRGDDFALERVRRDLRAAFLDQSRREVLGDELLQLWGVGQLRGEDGFLQGDLGVSEQDGEFR